MPGSLKEQSNPLEFAKFESINDLFDHLIWRWNFKNQSGKYAICTRMRDPSPKMKKNIFVRFSGLISSKSKSEIKSMKNHIFWWEVAWLLANNLRNLLPDFISFFSQSTWFSTNHVKCVLWLNKTWTDIKFLLNSTD